jgi:predicted ATPase/DNA-binding NarL/FixJ family response regulator
VGRQQELAELRALLGSARLLTLTGTAGVGKTRLALAAATQALADYADGVWLADLAQLTHPERVGPTIASTFHVQEEVGKRLTDTLAEALHSRQLLLVLDNCEHVVQRCAEVAQDLLLACPKLSMLVTSREPLAVPGEMVWRVLGLRTLHPYGRPSRPSEASDAVQLFVRRAGAAGASFQLSEHNAPLINELCTRLEGMPLAIELAAARMSVLTPEQVLARLDDQLELLTGSARTGPPRQRTLRATLDWSYGLLSEPEQVLLNRLSVFAGGCTLEAVEAVCTGDIPPADVLGLLGRLVDKSMVSFESEGAIGWYRVLEVVRQYARERLVERDELATRLERHAAFYVTLAEREGRALLGANPKPAHERLRREHDNLRSALTWLMEREDIDAAWRLGAALCTLWYLHQQVGEGRSWVARLLGLYGGQPTTRIALLHGAGQLAWAAGDVNMLRNVGEESVVLARAADPQALPFSLWILGLFHFARGEYEVASSLHEKGRVASRAANRRVTEVLHLLSLGVVAAATRALDTARARWTEARALADSAGFVRGAASAQALLALIVCHDGDLLTARSMLEECLRTWESLGQAIEVGLVHLGLGIVAMAEGDLARAQSWLCQALATSLAGGSEEVPVAAGHNDVLLRSLDALAQLAALSGQPARAVRLTAHGAARRGRLGLALTPADAASIEGSIAPARASLGPLATASAQEVGRAMTLQEAIDDALAIEPAAAPESMLEHPADGAAQGRLTSREWEVATLIARGYSNQMIAEALVVVESTAARHVHNILAKLALSSRTQIAAWAFERGVERERV